MDEGQRAEIMQEDKEYFVNFIVPDSDPEEYFFFFFIRPSSEWILFPKNKSLFDQNSQTAT